jgi:hypothetical protein
MRQVLAVAAVMLVAACADPTPTGPTLGDPRLHHGGGNPDQHVFNTQLRPENEPQGSTSQALGHAQITVEDGMIFSDIVINNKEEESFFACHIHLGPEGTNGPIVWDLFFPPSSDRHIRASGPATFSTRANNPFRTQGESVALAVLLANPEMFYVNCHTTANPAGAIRGQLP